MLKLYLPVIELVCVYLEGFSECLHGLRPSVCAHCRTLPRNRPERWGYDPDATAEENQWAWDEYQAALAKFFAGKGAEAKAEAKSMGYGPAMRVDRRPINAIVRAVHVSKQGQVNVKELGISRYNEVLAWGRKYCGWHGVYERRLK